MERSPKGIYTPEFRAEAVKLVETTGMSVARAAKQLSIPKSSLDNWVRASRKGELADVGKGQRLPTELELELARTRKELADVKMERDLLKRMARPVCKQFFRERCLIGLLRRIRPRGEPPAKMEIRAFRSS